MNDKYTSQEINQIMELAKEGNIKEVFEYMSKSLDSNNLMIISLEDESSVPKVFYKGEEINYKCNVFFDWDTDTDYPGGLTYAIEHAETNKEYPVINRIERKVKGHAFD